MRSPWKTEDPFAPMFDECVVITIADGTRRSVPCCVFLDQTGEVLAESTVDTTREDILISAEKPHHALLRELRRGDRIFRPETNRRTYAVQSVEWDVTMGLVVRARSV